MNFFNRVLVGAAAALLFAGHAPADDTDIFNTAPSLSTSRPNVLIVLDSSANWSASFGAAKKFNAEVAALKARLASETYITPA